MPCPDLEVFRFQSVREGNQWQRPDDGDIQYMLLLEGIARLLETRWATPTPASEASTRTHFPTPLINIRTEDRCDPSKPNMELVLDRIRKIAVVDGVVRVDVDVGFSAQGGFPPSVLWPDEYYAFFGPELPLENVLRALEDMRMYHVM